MITGVLIFVWRPVWIWIQAKRMWSSIFRFRVCRLHPTIRVVTAVSSIRGDLVHIVVSVENLTPTSVFISHDIFWCCLTCIRKWIFLRYGFLILLGGIVKVLVKVIYPPPVSLICLFLFSTDSHISNSTFIGSLWFFLVTYFLVFLLINAPFFAFFALNRCLFTWVIIATLLIC